MIVASYIGAPRKHGTLFYRGGVMLKSPTLNIPYCNCYSHGVLHAGPVDITDDDADAVRDYLDKSRQQLSKVSIGVTRLSVYNPSVLPDFPCHKVGR